MTDPMHNSLVTYVLANTSKPTFQWYIHILDPSDQHSLGRTEYCHIQPGKKQTPVILEESKWVSTENITRVTCHSKSASCMGRDSRPLGLLSCIRRIHQVHEPS